MDNGIVAAAILVSSSHSERMSMLKIIASATLSAMCRDLGPRSRYCAGCSHRYSNIVRYVSHSRLNARHVVAAPRNLRNLDLHQ
jgi:hypothetical protein